MTTTKKVLIGLGVATLAFATYKYFSKAAPIAPEKKSGADGEELYDVAGKSDCFVDNQGRKWCFSKKQNAYTSY